MLIKSYFCWVTSHFVILIWLFARLICMLQPRKIFQLQYCLIQFNIYTQLRQREPTIPSTQNGSRKKASSAVYSPWSTLVAAKTKIVICRRVPRWRKSCSTHGPARRRRMDDVPSANNSLLCAAIILSTVTMINVLFPSVPASNRGMSPDLDLSASSWHILFYSAL